MKECIGRALWTRMDITLIILLFRLVSDCMYAHPNTPPPPPPPPPPTHTQQITNYGKTYKCTVVRLKTSTMLQYINNLWFLESPLRGPKYNMIHVKLTKNLKGLSERGPTVCNFLGRFCFLSRHFSRAFCEGNKAYS